MEIKRLGIEGSALIQNRPFTDHRGTFMEAYNWEEFADTGLPQKFLQDNISTSKRGVLRGLHIQRNLPQGKMVRCLRGEIIDVFIDLRPDSPTFLKIEKVHLSEKKAEAVYVPPGCAHGFYSMANSTVLYKCTTLYDKNSDGGICPTDPALSIAWPTKSPIMSDKDSRLPTLKQWLKEHHGKEIADRA